MSTGSAPSKLDPKYGKDPLSALSHFVGFIGALVGTIVLVVLAEGPAKTGAMAVYGGALMSLFAASTAYHFFDLSIEGNRRLRRLDHGAIFLFIAGSNVPPALHGLGEPWRTRMLVSICGLALLGLIVKVAWMKAPRWFTGGIYLVLGWIALIPIFSFIETFTLEQLILLYGGGGVYSSGAVIYALKRPDPWPGIFGFHEVWHVFVLVGAAMHFALMHSLLEAPIP